MKFSQKEHIVSKIQSTANKALSLIIADTAGIKVNEINQLRKACSKTEIHLYSTRNSLMIRGIKDTSFCKMQDLLQGQCLLGFYLKENPDITAKVFNEFSQKIEHNRFIKGVCAENKIFTGQQIDLLITLPNYEGALIKILFILKWLSVGRLLAIFLLIIRGKNG